VAVRKHQRLALAVDLVVDADAVQERVGHRRFRTAALGGDAEIMAAGRVAQHRVWASIRR